MIADPGRPFSKSFADLIDAMQIRLTSGVEMPASLTLAYQEGTSAYDLPSNLLTLTTVWAQIGSRVVTCQPGRDATINNVVTVVGGDYVIRGSKLVWRAVSATLDAPETLLVAGMMFTIEYTVRGTPSGINDFLPGSIAGTLVRAITREMTLMYSQIDEAYRRAFLMQAEGIALDNVVALLGVYRNPAVKAVGSVTFFVKQPPLKPIAIPAGTQVADAGGRLFATLADKTIGVTDQNVTVDAAALDPGPQGNADVNTITVMPTPPRGVDSVTNIAAFMGGQVAEADDALRERAQHALDRAGKGTLNAIKYAVKAIQGVEEVEVRDHTLDGTIPLGEVHVYYSGGNNLTGLDNKVQLVVNDTRSAGIFPRIFTIDKVNIGGVFYLLPDVGIPDTAPAAFRQDVVAAITALPVGGALSLRRLNALVYNEVGLKDVAEAQLTSTVRGTTQAIATDPLTIKATDTLMTSGDAIKVVVIRALVITDKTKITVTHDTKATPPTYTLTFPVQLTDGTAPLPFLNFILNINVALTVTSKTNNSVQTIIGPYRAAAVFKGDGKTASTAMAQIIVPDVPGTGLPADRIPLISASLSADGYPAIPAITTDVTLP